MAVTLTEICDGIEAVLSTAIGMQSSTSYDEMTEGIPAMDCPRIEVYPEAGSSDPSGRTDRTTFNACIQQVAVVVHADLYARQRSQLGEDVAAYVGLTDAIIDVLQSQQTPPFFGVVGIKAFNWGWRKAVFRRADARFVGARFVINCKIF